MRTGNNKFTAESRLAEPAGTPALLWGETEK